MRILTGSVVVRLASDPISVAADATDVARATFTGNILMTPIHWWIVACAMSWIGWGLTVMVYCRERKWRLQTLKALENLMRLQVAEKLKIMADELADLENERHRPDNDQVQH